MNEISIHTAPGQKMTCVSNTFIDDYMPAAGGEFVKIYLYLLRVLSDENGHFDPIAMADKFHYTESDIKRALSYWEEHHLLQLECDGAGQICGICMIEPQQLRPAITLTKAAMPVTSIPAASIAQSDAKAAPTASSVAPFSTGATGTEGLTPAIQPSASERVHHYTPEELSHLSGQDDVQEILFIAQQYFGRMLNRFETDCLLSWYDMFHFSVEMIDYLIDYCITSNHNSIRYMNTIATSWVDEGITTVSDAKTHTKIHSQATYAIMKAFGISNRNLTGSELNYITKWTREYKLPLNLITLACERTIKNTGRSNFDYTDKILATWHANGVTQADDVAALDAAHADSITKKASVQGAAKTKNRFHNFEQRPADDAYYEEVERQLLRK